MAHFLVKAKNLKVIFHVNEIKKYFENSEHADMSLMVVSIGGRNYQGQTFLMNLLMMYAQATYVDGPLMESLPPQQPQKRGKGAKTEPVPDPVQWLNVTKFNGFTLDQAETIKPIGIVMYPIMATQHNNTAILFLDTQGLTNANGIERGASYAILALTAMLSSVQIYNVINNLRGNNIQALDLATLYAKLIASRTKTDKIQQKLVVLVRDWPHDHELPPGHKSGQTYLDRIFNPPEKEEQNQRLVDNIKSFYKEIDCFLLPSVGKEAKDANPLRFQEMLALVKEDFKVYMKEFAPLVLAPENLNVKTVNGRPFKVRDFWRYLETWVKDFNSSEIPVIEVDFETTTLANTMIAKEAAYVKYNQEMSRFEQRKQRISDEVLEEFHKEAVSQGLIEFDKSPKLGEEGFAPNQRQRLLEELNELFQEYKVRNQHRNSWLGHLEELWERYGWLTMTWWWIVIFGIIYYSIGFLNPYSRFKKFADDNSFIIFTCLLMCLVAHYVYTTYIKRINQLLRHVGY